MLRVLRIEKLSVKFLARKLDYDKSGVSIFHIPETPDTSCNYYTIILVQLYFPT